MSNTAIGKAGPSDRSLFTLGGLDRTMGMIDGRWTPMAAKQAAWLVAQITPATGEELLRRMGNMKPSKSSLERLPKTLQTGWKERTEAVEAELGRSEHVPDNASHTRRR